MVNQLSERAEQTLQRMYENTPGYMSLKIGIDLRNMFQKKENKQPFPRYKDTILDEEYYQEVIGVMNGLYEEEKEKEINENTDEYSTDKLIVLVRLWSISKLLNHADSSKQFLKVTEEVGEIAAALARDDQEELIDALGDTVVTLIILAQQKGLRLEDCLATAYDVIKDRTGEMKDGVFVKSEDLDD